jgi:rubrerythrin
MSDLDEEYDDEIRKACEMVHVDKQIAPLRPPSFWAKFRCLNCGQCITLQLPRGTLVRNEPCPNCGVSPKRLQESELC